MKRILYILVFAFPLLATSCLMEEKENFEQTPAERMDAFLVEYKTLLESNEDGWLFECFPQKDQQYGGYAYILKFKDGNVTAYFELGDEAATSTYRMTTDDGPVISFDTFNENLHFFANPSASKYQGYQGDYEYNILGSSEDKSEIYIKGRKSGNKMTLRKFTGTDPEAYFAAQTAIAQAMEAPAAKISVNGVESSCSISNNIFSYTEVKTEATETTPAETVDVECAYCFTDKGIRFYHPVTIGGIEYVELTYSNETYVSADGKIVITLVFPPVNEQFVSSYWYLDPNASSEYAQTYFTAGFNAIGKKGYAFRMAVMGDPGVYGMWGLYVNFGGYGGQIEYDYQVEEDNKLTLTMTGNAAGNGGTFANWGLITSLVPFGTGKPVTFTVEADNPRKPTVFTLTQVDNPDNVIVFTE